MGLVASIGDTQYAACKFIGIIKKDDKIRGEQAVTTTTTSSDAYRSVAAVRRATVAVVETVSVVPPSAVPDSDVD